jgi:hypothetical protein
MAVQPVDHRRAQTFLWCVRSSHLSLHRAQRNPAGIAWSARAATAPLRPSARKYAEGRFIQAEDLLT